MSVSVHDMYAYVSRVVHCTCTASGRADVQTRHALFTGHRDLHKYNHNTLFFIFSITHSQKPDAARSARLALSHFFGMEKADAIVPPNIAHTLDRRAVVPG